MCLFASRDVKGIFSLKKDEDIDFLTLSYFYGSENQQNKDRIS
jgi:hypothetical protein